MVIRRIQRWLDGGESAPAAPSSNRPGTPEKPAAHSPHRSAPTKPRLMPLLQLPGAPGEPASIGRPRDHAGATPWVQIDTSLLPAPIEALAERDTIELPSIADREGYFAERHFDYWLSGLRDWSLICRWAQAAGAPVSAATRLLDLGSSSGRVLRHFVAQSGVQRPWAADINRRNAAWLREYMPPHVRVLPSTALPHLPIEDRSLDLVYALSVINHIDHLELMWLAEIRRMLRPGGVCVLSVATETAWSLMGPDVPLFADLLRRKDDVAERPISLDLFRAPMPEERVVFTYRGRELYQCNIFHAEAYIRREWSRLLGVVEIIPRGFDTQDAVVLRRDD